MRKQLRRFLLFVIPVLAVFHAYIGWSLLPSLSIGRLGMMTGIILLVLSLALIPMGMTARFIIKDAALADRMSWIGSTTMGFFSSLLVLTLLRNIILLAFAGTQEQLSISAITTILLALIITIIGYVNARRLAKVVRIDIPLTDLPNLLHGFTIVQISDLHVGPTIKANYVSAIVDRVNSLKPDLIAITGDVVDGSVQQLSNHTAPLERLSARHGTFIVTGNHEYYSGAIEWVKEFERLGLRTMMNEHSVIDHEGAQLLIAGVTDYTAHLFDLEQRSDPHAALEGSPEGIHKVLLAHQPRTATEAASAGFDLQLSGHTHGGQFWPWNLFVGLQQPFTSGLHRLGKLWIYTSRGTGYWGPPKRFGAPSEITLIRLISN
jgi:uncharacterized protein